MRRVSLLVIIFFSITFIFGVTQLQARDAAKFSFIKGKVSVIVKGKERNANYAIKLNKGDSIITSSNGIAEIRFEGGSKIRIRKNSKLTLTKYSFSKSKGRSTNIKLDKGSMFAKVRKLKAKGKTDFNVSAINATAGVRGTQFYIGIESEKINDQDKKVVEVEVTEGEVEVQSKNETVNVTPYEGTKVVEGEAPSKPKKLKKTRQVEWAD